MPKRKFFDAEEALMHNCIKHAKDPTECFVIEEVDDVIGES